MVPATAASLGERDRAGADAKITKRALYRLKVFGQVQYHGLAGQGERELAGIWCAIEVAVVAAGCV